MNHDTPERSCNCRASSDKGGCIMTPSTGYPFPTIFSSCSKKDLDISLGKGIGMCLFNVPEVKELFGGQKCGNGYVEDREECDCGEPEECMNPCCNASTCTLKLGAVCAHGLCCEDCKLKPAGTPCRDSSNSCDLPEFCTGANPHCPANVYLHDGHPCYGVDGYCHNGMCQTHEQQCITLWGQGAKPAPGICFERVNSAGDPYGNCGKDSKGLFTKCETRDAKCGKIQCQGGANRPVIGTNAVSIETNIPLQAGGKILCRGTHVYLGDDMPDPGLVLAGTKCGDGKVCNNNKNCHCQADWAPPFCEKPGFGGSVDSGPIRLADNSSVTVGIVVTILSLIIAGLIICFKRKTIIRLISGHKKTTIEKLRSVSPSRSSRSSQTSSSHNTTPSKKTAIKPQNSSIYKPADHFSDCLLLPHTVNSQGMKRQPQFQPIQISNPIPASLYSQQSLTPQWVLPPLKHPKSQPGVPARSLSSKLSFRDTQENFKPSPPQKPLPANPLNRNARFNDASKPSPEHRVPVPRIQPVRPAPKHPPQVPKFKNLAY
nr:PREDICTED: disintegrin and metalloproteinase domain-containing protein 12-like isoform X2 [Latimeria chalumnae]|eukprot:XP_014339394.1 PREDICTED: disintegrin and metalloproteinase domain-containing protein 12-like isoform X2 [Latimeria chalumnae]